eukprot:comp14818_c0_seq1/m.11280 comp14818_c0_seq1/g.11280  ORF comp14818_c0_seq1/g.11280 comp14818_c0_seq1/m.11280 type:complete len:907 (-) comp14818_c0_seq1:492-3212(-)
MDGPPLEDAPYDPVDNHQLLENMNPEYHQHQDEVLQYNAEPQGSSPWLGETVLDYGSAYDREAVLRAPEEDFDENDGTVDPRMLFPGPVNDDVEQVLNAADTVQAVFDQAQEFMSEPAPPATAAQKRPASATPPPKKVAKKTPSFSTAGRNSPMLSDGSETGTPKGRTAANTESKLAKLWTEEKDKNYKLARAHLQVSTEDGSRTHHTLLCSVCRELGIDLTKAKTKNRKARGAPRLSGPAAGPQVNGGENGEENHDRRDSQIEIPGLGDTSNVKVEDSGTLLTGGGGGQKAVQNGSGEGAAAAAEETRKDDENSDDSGSEVEEGCGFPKRYFRLTRNNVTRCGVISCRICHASTHTVCSGITSLPDARSWVCSRCQAGLESVQCELCPNRGGVFKRTDDNKWVHQSCALWTPLALFNGWISDGPGAQPGGFQEPVSLALVEKARWTLKCKVCAKNKVNARNSLKKGKSCCIQCCAGKCAVAFHVTCAQDSLPIFIRWDLFPAAVSAEGFCLENHVSSVHRKKRQEEAEKARQLRQGTKVWARYSDGLWYRGLVEYTMPRRVCHVALDEDTALHEIKDEDLVCINEDADGDHVIDVDDRVEIRYKKPPKTPPAHARRVGARGTVVSVEEYVLYRIEFVDGYSTQCRRNDLCTEAEWRDARPPGAKEGISQEEESSESDVDASEIDKRFIIPRNKRQSAKAAEAVNKKYVSDPGAVGENSSDASEYEMDEEEVKREIAEGKRPATEVGGVGEAQPKMKKPKLERMGSVSGNVPAKGGEKVVRDRKISGEKVKTQKSVWVSKPPMKAGEGGAFPPPSAVAAAVFGGGSVPQPRAGSPVPRQRTASDDKIKKADPQTKAVRRCGRDKCGNRVGKGSGYCSYECASQAAEALFKAWVVHRKAKKEEAEKA